MHAKDRARILRRWADLMIQHQDELARLLTTEQGKPLAESRVEIQYAASFYEWFGEEGKRVYGDTIPTYAADRRIVVTKDPIGVTGGITPWNFPAAMPTRKSAPALAAGCTMVLKPAEQTPLSALAIAQLGLEAGLPEGVFQVVTGAAEDAPVIGGEMTSNHTVGKLGFTGSTEIGKVLMEQCAKQVKEGALELGGNAPFMVFEGAERGQAVIGPVAGVARFSTEEEAVRAANNTPFGLATYYYTRDMARIWRLSESLEYGIHGINTGLISAENVPFGGVKESGIGREGSKYGIDE